MPGISIIVPVYKVENYIRTCVDSILAQSFTDFELILVDDGSPDNCGLICDEYAMKDSRVRVIHQDNAGLSCARNAGINIARGEYLCFVDSDDAVATFYCERLYELLQGNDCDFSVCGTLRFADGEDCFELGRNETTIDHNKKIIQNSELLKAQVEKKSEFGVWNKLYRKRVFENHCFAPKMLHEDVIWSSDLAMDLKNGVAWTDEKLYYYRQRGGGIVSTQSKKCSRDRIIAGRCVIEAAEKLNCGLKNEALRYAVEYPWMFVDGIYVRREFKENKAFLDSLQNLLRDYCDDYKVLETFSEIQRKRMRLFAKSRFLYGFNAYGRLLRLYVYRVMKKDPYKDGHGI